jgi:hypothetical protein
VVVFPCVVHQSGPSLYLVGMKTIHESCKHEVDAKILRRNGFKNKENTGLFLTG